MKTPSIWPNEQQELLFKAVFGKEAKHSLATWHAKFDLSNLDHQTKAILPMLLGHLKNRPECKDELALFQTYARTYQLQWMDNLFKINQLKAILDLFQSSQVQVCLLKGTAMLLHYYKSLGMRSSVSDIDILIKKQDLVSAIHILQKAGFTPKKYHEWTGQELEQDLLKQRSSLQYAHAITYVKDQFEIDLHWKDLQYLKSNSLEDSTFTIEKAGFCSYPVYVFAPESQWLHICIHGMHQTIKGAQLWWLMDCLYLLQNYQHQFDWQKCLNLIQQNGFAPMLYDFACYAKQINPDLIPDEFIKKLQKIKSSFSARFLYQLTKANVGRARSFDVYYKVFSNAHVNQPFLFKLLYLNQFMRHFFGLQNKQGALSYFISKICSKGKKC
jgi:hypothetical protein